MKSEQDQDDAARLIVKRTNALYDRNRQRTYKDTDRLFAAVLVGQWVFGILVAVIWSPYTWAGKVRTVNFHVWIAALLGLAIISLPVLLALKKPGAAPTRYVIAFAQMLYSALLIHLTGGRIETHFHVFVSLAVLAFYRDMGVLVLAAVTVALDHFVRGIIWPESVYGITNPEWWRFLEHAFWVVLLVAGLIVSIHKQIARARTAAKEAAIREAMTVGEWQAALDGEQDRATGK